MRTAVEFSLALFPQVFLFQRILQADVIFVLSSRIIDQKQHVNRCALRRADGSHYNLVIPIERLAAPAPIDQTPVQDPKSWLPAMLTALDGCYRGLKFAKVAKALVHDSLENIDSPWLTDYLMSTFVATRRTLGWEHKEIVRVDSVELGTRLDESHVLVNCCGEYNCDRLIVGKAERLRLKEKLFREKKIELVTQHWCPPSLISAQDSVLDNIARYSTSEIVSFLRQRGRLPRRLPRSRPG